MAVLDLFKKKKEPTLPPPEAFPPMPGGPPPPPPGFGTPGLSPDIIAQYKQQGYADDQIIDALSRQGYTPAQVQDALAQYGATQGPEPFPPPPTGGVQQPPARGIEELAEAIIEEKWRDLQGDLTKLKEKQDKTDSRLDKAEQSLNDLRADIDSLHKGILAKISDYDKNLLDVGTEIKAMERVFQKVLPELTSNVQELGRITRKVKEEK